jgi:hypothetical protein
MLLNAIWIEERVMSPIGTLPTSEANTALSAVEVKADAGRALIFCFDAFSLREPVSTPDQVRGRLSLENALSDFR